MCVRYLDLATRNQEPFLSGWWRPAAFCATRGCAPGCIVSVVQRRCAGCRPPALRRLPLRLQRGLCWREERNTRVLPLCCRWGRLWSGGSVACEGLRCWRRPGADPLAHRRWSRSECCLKRLSHGFTNVLWPEDVFLTSKGCSAWLGASQTGVRNSSPPLMCSNHVRFFFYFFGVWCFLKAALTCVQVRLALKLVNTNLSCGQCSF